VVGIAALLLLVPGAHPTAFIAEVAARPGAAVERALPDRLTDA
jgi:hypothetical protein